MSGISALYVDGLELRIKELHGQVEKLTKERDIKEHCIVQLEDEHLRMKGQIGALAEQNEKMRKALDAVSISSLTHTRVKAFVDKSLSLPDLASPALNRIHAEGLEGKS